MGVLLSCQGLGKAHGHRLLFHDISFGLDDGERCGLIGPNGSGKSTLLSVLAGLQPPDEGDVIRRRNLTIALVPQEEQAPEGLSVAQVIAESVADLPMSATDRDVRVAVALSRAGFEDPDALVGTLSGGWRKRLAIAAAMARQPDLLLLDEPTNHLDVEGIMWLEQTLKSARFAWLAVSHDRYLLEHCARRIIEINPIFPQGHYAAPGRYSEFLQRREETLATEQRREQSLRAQVRREIEWLQRGPQGRGTKSRSRIREAGRLMNELADVSGRRRTGGAPEIDFAATGRQADKLVELKRVTTAYGDRMLLQGLDLVLSSKTRLGLLGSNGSGKTTLLNVITGERPPDAGKVRHAEGLRVARFEQDRGSLSPGQALQGALSPHGEHIEFQGRTMHVVGWARRFGFRKEQLDMPVDALSGGEQARILIARAMAHPADLLVLDEPSNDLDIQSLEMLEDSLAEFPGAVVLVTHDRYLLERVSTEILALDGQGGTRWCADFADWWDYEQERRREAARREAPAPAQAATERRKPRSRKLSYREQREFDGIEEAIMAAEAEAAELHETVADPAVAADPERMKDACAKLADAEAEVERLYARWAELDARSG